MTFEQDVVGLETSISDAAWSIIQSEGVKELDESVSVPEQDMSGKTPRFISEQAPDISKIKVPSGMLRGLIVEDEEETIPIKTIIKQTSSTNLFLTEPELKILQEAQKIIAKVLEMTTCGSIGVNMAGSTPKPKKAKAVKYKPTLKKKKTLNIISKLEKYE